MFIHVLMIGNNYCILFLLVVLLTDQCSRMSQWRT